ncbi:MAG: transcription termination/antitermination protein NusA [Limnochordales bacterium]|nr:transcription termination/antitermination protein NusA [Limnochordales bacterium]
MRELEGALNELERERGIPREVLREAIQQAIVHAYKRHFGGSDEGVRIDIGPAGIRVFRRLKVVADEDAYQTGETRDEEGEPRADKGKTENAAVTATTGENGQLTTGEKVVKEPAGEEGSTSRRKQQPRLRPEVIPLSRARQIRPDYQVGDTVEVEVTPRDFGRIAAQSAKQVLVQRLREAERALVYEQFANKEGDIVTGVITRRENRNIIVDLGKVEAVMLPSEQVPSENYQPGTRLKVYISEVRRAAKGPQVFVSRTHPGLLKRLFELEVPEIHDGIVEIKAVAREPGHRSKIAVYSRKPGVDPVGACVGPRGMRVQNVVQELRGEKVDIITWDPLPEKFIARALEPAEVQRVLLRPQDKSARVIVPDNKLSLAIGREGQNARLAAKLTGWKIDIKSTSQMAEILAQELFTPATRTPAATEMAGREQAAAPSGSTVAVPEVPAGVASAESDGAAVAKTTPVAGVHPVAEEILQGGVPEAAGAVESEPAEEVPVEEASEEKDLQRRRIVEDEEAARPARRSRGARREKEDEVELEILADGDEPLPTLFTAEEEQQEAKSTSGPPIRRTVRNLDEPLAAPLAALLKEKGLNLPGLNIGEPEPASEKSDQGKKEPGAAGREKKGD